MAEKLCEIQGNLCENSPPVDGESSKIQTGRDINHIREVLAKCMEKCFEPVRFEKISSSLAEVREKNPAVFDSIVPQLIERLHVNVKEELDLMFEQENLVSLCHQLDDIAMAASTDTEKAWRPSGVPKEDIKDHVIKVKLEFRKKLKEKLNQLQNDNKVLENSLKTADQEITDTEQRIIAKHNQLQTIATACDNLTSGNKNDAGDDSLENIIKQFKT